MKRRILPIATAALVAVALGGCKSTDTGGGVPIPPDPAIRSADIGSAATPVPTPPRVSVNFAGTDADVAAGSWSTQFALPTTREIIVVTQWEPRAGTHVARIEIITPDGGLYRSVHIPFTSDPNRRASHLDLPGVIGKVPVRFAPRLGSTPVQVVDRLPVSGTPIMRNIVAGTWSTRVFYDGQGPLATAAFEVLP
jgi:hypothetical protein